jgi:hypothetical protein
MLSLFFIAVAPVSAQQKIQTVAQKARSAEGKVLRCSPDGADGTVNIYDAPKLLKPGMVLKLLPGSYNPRELIIFEQNNIVIEGDTPSRYCDLNIIAYGKDVVVRNIHARTVEGGDITIIDSRFLTIYITNGGKKIEAFVINCAANYLHLYPEKSEITVANSTVLQAFEVAEAVYADLRYAAAVSGSYNIVSVGTVTKGSVTFEKCLLYSNWAIFGLNTSNKALELTLDGNIIYFAKAFVFLGKDKCVTDLKTLKDYCALKLKDENIVGSKPVFEKEANVKTTWNFSDPKFFILKPESVGYGKNIGVNTDPKSGMPSGVITPPAAPAPAK